MSTLICNKVIHPRIALSDMLNFNDFMGESLAEFVNRTMRDKRLSGSDVAKASRGGIAQSTVNRIQNADVLTPSVPKLKALARGLGVAEHELFAVARGIDTSRTLAHDRLTAIDENYQGLSRQDKHQVDYLLEVLVREVERMMSVDISKRQSVPILRENAVSEVKGR